MGRTKLSLEERLARHTTAREVGDTLGRGIDRLPVSELTRTMLKHKTREVAVTVAETGTALTAAARDGAHTFQATRADEAGRGSGASPATPAGSRPRADAPGSDDDVSVRLERLAGLHAAGHLDDREYLAAKAKILGLDT